MILVHVGNVDHLLAGNKAHFAVKRLVGLVTGVRIGRHRQPFFEQFLQRLCNFQLRLQLAIALGLARQPVELAFELLEVRQDQLQVDHLDIFTRVGFGRYMHHVGVVETAHDMDDRSRLANIREKLVAQPFTLAGALYQAGNVHEFDRGINYLLRLD